MKNQSYWKDHYVIEGDASEVERNLRRTAFVSQGERFELPFFEKGKHAPNILISQGSGGHAYVFAELGYQIHSLGYNVFIMPRHGGHTVQKLMTRHVDALWHISSSFNDRIGILSEGLGGYVVFYLALAHGPVKSIVCQNSPAIMTESKYHLALLNDRGLWAAAAQRRRAILPLAKLLVRMLPNLPLPISSYLDWAAIVDPRAPNRKLERQLVEGYLRDQDFDRWYPLSAILSLVSTPPPNPLEQLKTPTMFVLTRWGPTVSYIRDLYNRLPPIKKRLVEVDGSVYWMLSHPSEEARIVCGWFDQTL